jgi:hypothetical protein
MDEHFILRHYLIDVTRHVNHFDSGTLAARVVNSVHPLNPKNCLVDNAHDNTRYVVNASSALQAAFPQIMDSKCPCHLLHGAYKKCQSDLLDTFSKCLHELHAHTIWWRTRFQEACGEAPRTFCSTRWLSNHEVLGQVLRLWDRFVPFVLGCEEDSAELQRLKVLIGQNAIIDLRTELTAIVMLGRPLHRAMYALETDQPICHLAYQIVENVLNELDLMERQPTCLTELADHLCGGSSDPQQIASARRSITDHGLSVIQPAINYIRAVFAPKPTPPVRSDEWEPSLPIHPPPPEPCDPAVWLHEKHKFYFLCRVINPCFAKTLSVDNIANYLKALFQFGMFSAIVFDGPVTTTFDKLTDLTLEQCLNEVPRYKTFLNDFHSKDDNPNQPFDFWRMHTSQLPKLSRVVRRVSCVLPSSAYVERVFSRVELLMRNDPNILDDVLRVCLFASCNSDFVAPFFGMDEDELAMASTHGQRSMDED